jgi:putative membrane protein
MSILLAKSLHIIFMVMWFSGLFYLPRLFVYHRESTDIISLKRFQIMEKKLYYYITTPGAIITILFGLYLIHLQPFLLHQRWLHMKLTLALGLILYHIYLGYCHAELKQNPKAKSSRFFRILNEIPVIFLFSMVMLAVMKP